ncbi:NAD(P)-binding protein [Cubamyces sp. BRFM 1775]|nr:NAD(P)-binding protein [Cubamyces sp. BRFM 1775]
MLSPKDLMASPMYARQKLVQEGWVYVDDDDYRIEFSQDWAVTRSSPQAYENSMHVVSLQGATATFVFAGTAVAVYGAVGGVAQNGWPSSSYAVDGSVYETYNFVSASGYSNASELRYQVPYFTVQGLSMDEHTLVITNLNGTAPNKYWLDYICFYPFVNAGSTSPAPSTQISLQLAMSASAAAQGSRVWLVTGASSGIGYATVQEVLAIGERVAATTRRASSLDSLTSAHTPSELLVLEYDIADPTKSADDLISRIVSHFGRLDVVVNNAGYGLNGVVEGTPDEAARAQLEVNFWAPVRISRAAVKFFRMHNPPEQGGRILNISSTGGFTSNPTLAFYSASKFALEGFSEGLHKELDPKWNIKVIVIQPGGVRTLWAGSNMVEVPLPPTYADPEGLTARFLQVMRGTKYIGDPNKVGRALITISEAENPPMRLPLGADARFVIQSKLNEIQREFDEWKELELSTIADDADPTFLAKLSGSVVKN